MLSLSRSLKKRRYDIEKSRRLLRRLNSHCRRLKWHRRGSRRRRRSFGGSNSGVALLRVEDGLELGRGLEAGVVRVLLVEVVVWLGLQLRGKILEDAGYQGVDGVLLERVAVPDGDEVGVEADGEANAADLVSYFRERDVSVSLVEKDE